nr:hypothetical protein [Chryseobacterium sp.]
MSSHSLNFLFVYGLIIDFLKFFRFYQNVAYIDKYGDGDNE